MSHRSPEIAFFESCFLFYLFQILISLSLFLSLDNVAKERSHSLISFHCGDAGIYAIEAVIQHLIFNHERNRDRYLTKLVGCVQNAVGSKNYDELLYGRVSLLYALCFVENELKASVNIHELQNVIRLDDLKRELVQKILSSGVEGRQQESDPSLSYHYRWHGKAYCGTYFVMYIFLNLIY